MPLFERQANKNNVFVTGTGRCGSVAFRLACTHAKNFTTGHETKSGNLLYPDNHIEINSHFRNCIPHLAKMYPKAKFIHLRRKVSDCVPSLALLGHGEVMQNYLKLHSSVMLTDAPSDVAWSYYQFESAMIEACLAQCVPEKNQRVVWLDGLIDPATNAWRQCWDWCGFEGNFEASQEVWKTKHNSGEARGEK